MIVIQFSAIGKSYPPGRDSLRHAQIVKLAFPLVMPVRSSFRPTKSKKTIIRSFRISEESFNVLEEEAAMLNVSVNTLVDQIIAVHTSYESFMEKFGMMRMARSTFRRLLEISSEDRVAQAARQHMKEMGKIAIIAKYGELNLTNLLGALFLMMTYGGWGEFLETELSQYRQVVTLTHPMGQNGSIYLSSFVKALFEEIDIEPRKTTTDQAVVIEIQT